MTPQTQVIINKEKICPSCNNKIFGRNSYAVYCEPCGRYYTKVTNKYNQKIKRLQDKLLNYQVLGDIGRIKQMIEWNKEAHQIIKRLKSKVLYLQKEKGINCMISAQRVQTAEQVGV